MDSTANTHHQEILEHLSLIILSKTKNNQIDEDLKQNLKNLFGENFIKMMESFNQKNSEHENIVRELRENIKLSVGKIK